MFTYEELTKRFSEKFNSEHFPQHPATLYEPNRYFLKLGGKRIRPVLCLMGNELFDEIKEGTWKVANAIELFHNFTLIHDDIMDQAPLRRGMPTVHEKFGQSTALLAGDVMLVAAYENLINVGDKFVFPIINLFNRTAKEVCEGQQLDMDFEKLQDISFDDYVKMIRLKTSVLLGASLQMGAIMGGAGERNQHLLYEFGRKLGLAFQVQDDYLDAFGNPETFGKQIGGDIKSNKKTFLLIHALESVSPLQKKILLELLKTNQDNKVAEILKMFRECNADEWAMQLQEKFMAEALDHLENVAVLNRRKQPLKELAEYLIKRQV